jgi:hypothetical protein
VCPVGECSACAAQRNYELIKNYDVWRAIMNARHFKKSQLGSVLSSVLLLAVSSAWAQNPVPSISTPLFPESLAPGGPSFVLTVDGSGFVSTSVVEWNGAALPTTFVSSDRLKANVPGANIASPGTAFVTVSSGGVISNIAYFEITNAATVSFNQSFYAVGSGPASVAVGDFNGDGRLDLVVPNINDNTVSILLGNGEGTFQPAVPYPVGNRPGAVAVGDFNGDGKLDLAVANRFDGTVSLLLGNGDGMFTAASGSPFAVGSIPSSLAVGDFNGDGKLDLAVSNSGGNTVSVLLGNGDGTFTAAPSFALGGVPGSIAAGDFDGDGNVDLAVLTGLNTVSVLVGNGKGSFTAAPGSPVTAGNSATSIAAGDFNGDGKLDLVVTSHVDDTVSVLLGNGDGSFTVTLDALLPAGYRPGPVALADLNGDGSVDLAVLSTTGVNDLGVIVQLGGGDGGFLAASTFLTPNQPTSVAVGDFNGDGRMDLAVVGSLPDGVSILLQPTPAPPPSASNISDVTAGSGLSGGGTSGDITLNNTGILSLATGTGLLSTGGQSPTLTLNTSFTDGRYLQLTGGTLLGGLAAPSFTGSAAGLTNLNPVNLTAGTAGINITGNSATATLAASAANALALGGVGPGGYALSAGSPSYIQNNSGPAQTANLDISGNAGIGGTLTVGTTGTPITEHLSILVNPSFPALKASTCASANFALGGAADGDTIALGVPNERMTGTGTVIYTAWVSAANTVTVKACDIIGTQKTAGTGSIRLDLWKH